MSANEKMNKLEQEVKAQRRTIDFLLDYLKLKPAKDELEQAIAALSAGDPSHLESYIIRGGKITSEVNQ